MDDKTYICSDFYYQTIPTHGVSDKTCSIFLKNILFLVMTDELL